MDFTIRAATLEDCKDISRMILVSLWCVPPRAICLRPFLTILKLWKNWNVDHLRHRQHAQSFDIPQTLLLISAHVRECISVDGRVTVSHVCLAHCNLTLSCRWAQWTAMCGGLYPSQPRLICVLSFVSRKLRDDVILKMKAWKTDAALLQLSRPV